MSILLIVLGVVFIFTILSFSYHLKLGQMKMANDEIPSDSVNFSCSALLF